MQIERMRAILDKIKEYNKIIIFRHKRPDGDAVGSTMGLGAVLRNTYPEKDVRLLNSDYSEYLEFLGKEDVNDVPDEFYTDALGIACKSLGVGADVWWATDRTKYSKPTTPDYSQEAMEREPQKEIPRRVEEPAPADNSLDLAIALNDMQSAPTLAECKRIWSQWPMFQTNVEFIKAKNDRKKYFETH